MKLLLPLLFFFRLLLVTNASFAQMPSKMPLKHRSLSKKHQERWEAGMLGGLSFHSGDLSTGNLRLNSGGGGGGLFTRYHFSDVWVGRANLQFGGLKGRDKNFDDIGRRIRNFSFASSYYDFGLLIEVEPLAKKRVGLTARSRNFISPYFHTGISGVLSVPFVDFNEPNKVASESDINLDKNNSNFFHAAFPLGAGIRFDINNNWMLGAETGIRLVFTDYLDGISWAGNPTKKDWIQTASLVVGYRFAPFRDKDGDGIPNDKDACPLEAGSRKTKGCPDRDSDGVPDSSDSCPDLAGTPVTMGCPDADEDGIEDSADACPGARGPAAMNGCPDSDGDGIPDQQDHCPDKPGSLVNSGCPDTTAIVVKESSNADTLLNLGVGAEKIQEVAAAKDSSMGESSISFVLENESNQPVDALNSMAAAKIVKLLVDVETHIVFDKNDEKLSDFAAQNLTRIAEVLILHPNYKLRVVGRTERSGNDLQDVLQSVARARAVCEFLEQKGVDFRRLNYVGSGSKSSGFQEGVPSGKALKPVPKVGK